MGSKSHQCDVVQPMIGGDESVEIRDLTKIKHCEV